MRFRKFLKPYKTRGSSFREHTTDERGFLLQTASISNIALSEGISPSALYVLCVMNYDEYFK